MQRQLINLYTVENIEKIDGADSIELVTFQEVGWQCVAKLGEFKPLDKAFYFEIDSLLPEKDERFSFLKNTGLKRSVIDSVEYLGYRLKTIKLRGVISQGLALPVSAFSEIDLSKNLSEQLRVVKWEPLVSSSNNSLGLFHSLIPKTDEERIQNLKSKFPNYVGTSWEITEKLEGQSCTVVMENINGVPTKRVYSRSLERSLEDNSSFSIVANSITIPVGYAVQGEVVGIGIQGNIYKLNKIDYYVYSVFNLSTGAYLSVSEQNKFLDAFGIKKVPTINASFTITEDTKLETILKLAEGVSVLSSVEREGIVFKQITDIVNKNNFNKKSFKAISNKYLLKQK